MVYANLLHTLPTPLHTPIQNTENQQFIAKCVCSVCKNRKKLIFTNSILTVSKQHTYGQ